MAASKHIGDRSEKKSFLNIATLIRSIQRAEGNMDCFQMGMIDCDQVDCKWRAFCLEVYPAFNNNET
ncbi:MAG: SAP domain-containing protein [Desulfobacteraceae bacterium]|nr:MAG: SAP domain-containing protein [Desulfobacteraceae bacterium]